MLAPDTVLQNRYRTVRQLGQGGMGTVYEAIDERLDTTVALKETHFTDERLSKQFEREARLLARLHHAALPRVIDHFSESNGQFLVMNFIAGEDLFEMLQQQDNPFPVDDVLIWGDQLLDALDYLHTQEPPIIHRDIKPQNLKLTGRGQIILLDFGLAKGFAGQISKVTTSGSIFGYTPNYAPLEQVQGTGTNERSDLYSLGATLYHLITGTIPPDALSRATAIMSEQADPLRPANEINSAVPVLVADVLHQAMANNPAKRPISAVEMRRLLSDAVQEQAPAKSTLRKTMLPPTLISPAFQQNVQEQESAPISPAAGAISQENLSETQKLQLEYWTTFRDFLLQSNSFLKPQKAQAQNWFPITISSHFRLEAVTQRKGRKICVYLVLSGPDAKPHFYLLQRDKEAIKHEIGEELEWSERQTRKQCYVFLCKYKTDPENKQDWEAQHEWLKEKLELFHRVFAPRVKRLDASDYSKDEIAPTPSSIENPASLQRLSSTLASPTIASPSPLPPAPSTELASSIAQAQLSTQQVQPARKSNRLTWIVGVVIVMIVAILSYASLHWYQRRTAESNNNIRNNSPAELIFSRKEIKRDGVLLNSNDFTVASLSVKYVARLKEIEGVEDVTPVILYRVANGSGGSEYVDGVDWTPYASMNGIKLLQGRAFLQEDENQPVILIDQTKASRDKLEVGKTLQLFDKTYTIIGIFSPQFGSSIKMPLKTIQKLLESPDKCSYIFIKCKNADQQQDMVKRIDAELPGNKIVFTHDGVPPR